MPRKTKPVVVEAHGVRVRVFKRGGRYLLDVRGGQRVRKSAKTADLDTAKAAATDLATELAKQKLTGVTPETLTLGQLFVAYFNKKGQTLSPTGKKAAESRSMLFLAAWKDSLPVAQIDQTSVDAYCTKRRRREVAPPVAMKMIEAEKSLSPLRDGALDSDFRWLSSVFNWATGVKLAAGKRLLDRNPLHDDVVWPREKNLAQPVASEDRYVRTIEQVDAVDPSGRLRLILVLSYETGRRTARSIANLRASDVLLTTDRIADALANEGMEEGRANRMPFGAIRWRPETDKTERSNIEPVSREARAALDRYMARHARNGDAPLFPSPRTDGKPLDRGTLYKWLMKAERLAGLPKLKKGAWHPYRRLLATDSRGLPDKDIMQAAGWKSAKTLHIYQKSDDAGVLAVFERRQRHVRKRVA